MHTVMNVILQIQQQQPSLPWSCWQCATTKSRNADFKKKQTNHIYHSLGFPPAPRITCFHLLLETSCSCNSCPAGNLSSVLLCISFSAVFPYIHILIRVFYQSHLTYVLFVFLLKRRDFYNVVSPHEMQTAATMTLQVSSTSTELPLHPS